MRLVGEDNLKGKSKRLYREVWVCNRGQRGKVHTKKRNPSDVNDLSDEKSPKEEERGF